MNIMKLCNHLQKNSLDIIYQYLTDFYKEIVNYQNFNELNFQNFLTENINTQENNENSHNAQIFNLLLKKK